MPYSSLHRFVVKEHLTGVPDTTVRLADTPPGHYAEMDFGRLGYHLDPASGRRQMIYTLLVVLCYGRHLFLWPLVR